jgi:hypothetical protein
MIPPEKNIYLWLPKYLTGDKFLGLEANWRPKTKLKIEPCVEKLNTVLES